MKRMAATEYGTTRYATSGKIVPTSDANTGTRTCASTVPSRRTTRATRRSRLTSMGIYRVSMAFARLSIGHSASGDFITNRFHTPGGAVVDPHRLTCDYHVTYCRGMDLVFRALADPTRRSLLDELFREDGQTLSALEGRFSMTRFGVMRHLRLLEEAGLVVTRRRGREKLHFLNPVPIRLVHDRWVSKYAEPWAAALSGLKSRL